jgi:hypothetical protein
MIQWALVVLGLVYFVTDSAIFAPVRVKLARGSWFRAGLFYCAACFGFWAGVLLQGLWPFEATFSTPWGVIPLKGALSGTAAMALGAVWKVYVPGSAFETEKKALGLE